ncbi:MAG: hypothetical protein ACYTXI_33445 [Nostoc sp.]
MELDSIEITRNGLVESIVSGGMRGMLLLLSPSDYLRAINGTLGVIVQN